MESTLSSLLDSQPSLITLRVESHFSRSLRLPDGYAYKGGAARALLFRALGIDPDATPRDIDVLRVAEEEPFEGSDLEVSQEFMPDDFRHGDGVEILEENYFSTRDFTINELLATDEVIVMTKQCLEHTQNFVVRLTDYEYPGMKMRAKAFRLQAEMMCSFERCCLDERLSSSDERHISTFWLALNLDRACQRSDEVAEAYIATLVELGYDALYEASSPAEAAHIMLSDRGLQNFHFRNVIPTLPSHHIRRPVRQEVCEWEQYDALPFRQGIGRR